MLYQLCLHKPKLSDQSIRVHTTNLNNKMNYAASAVLLMTSLWDFNTKENLAKYRILLALAMHYNYFIYIILPYSTSIELMKF